MAFIYSPEIKTTIRREDKCPERDENATRLVNFRKRQNQKFLQISESNQ
jgi:hypothetical protein